MLGTVEITIASDALVKLYIMVAALMLTWLIIAYVIK